MKRGKLKKDKVSQWLNHLVLFFCVATVLYQVIFLVAPVRIIMFDWHLTTISSALAMAGFGLFVLDLLVDRTFLRAKNVLPLMAVLAVMCVSTLLWREYGLSSNAKVIIWQINQMLVIFPAYRRLSSEQWKRVMRMLYWVICLFYIPTVLASLYQFFTLFSTKVAIGGNLTRLGFQEGRLFGMFSGIFFSTVMVALMMVASIYYAAIAKRRPERIVCIVFAVLYGVYVILSGTRSVLVGCMVCAAVMVFLFLNQALTRKGMGIAKRTLVCLAAAIVVVGGIYLLDGVVNDTLKQAAVALNAQSDPNLTPSPTDPQASTSETIPEETTDPALVELEREDVGINNISNNRFTIWSNYLKVCTQDVKSILLGYSPGGYMVAIREQYPDEYIVQHIRDYYPHMYQRDLIYDAHNGYLLVFVTTGLLGVAAIGVFLILCVKQVLPRMYAQSRTSPEQYVLLALLLVILTAVFFDSDLFFKCTSTSVTFWLLAGLMLKSMEPTPEKP